MTHFVKVAAVSDFQDCGYKTFRLLARPVAVFKDNAGGFYAMEMRCKHQNWDLTTGPMKNGVVTCPRHGWQYDLATGECLNHESAPLRRHAIKVEDGMIYVSLTPGDETE